MSVRPLFVALLLVSWSSSVSAKTQHGADGSDIQQEVANEFRRRGVDIDLRMASTEELAEWKRRIDEARLLERRYGLIVDWRAHSLQTMQEWQARVEAASDLRKQGYKLDWRLYSLEELRRWRRIHPTPASSGLADVVETCQDRGAQVAAADRQARRDDTDDLALMQPTFASPNLYTLVFEDSLLIPKFIEKIGKSSKSTRH